jgi:hypothetical protein
MTVDPRAALDRFLAALEAHYHAIESRRGDDDPAVDDAYDVLADAFEVYDDALGTVHGEAMPFYLAEDDGDDDDLDDDADDEDPDDEADDLEVELEVGDDVEGDGRRALNGSSVVDG